MGRLIPIILAAVMLSTSSVYAWSIKTMRSEQSDVASDANEPREEAAREPARVYTDSEVGELARSRDYIGGPDEEDIGILPQLHEPTRGRSLQQIQNEVMAE